MNVCLLTRRFNGIVMVLYNLVFKSRNLCYGINNYKKTTENLRLDHGHNKVIQIDETFQPKFTRKTNIQ